MLASGGVYAILCTPFQADESVDDLSLRKLVRFVRSKGVDGVVALAIFGEGGKLNESERAAVVDAVIEEAAGDLPVVVSVGHLSSRLAAEMAVRAKKSGAAAVMALPSANAKTVESLAAYYSRIADAFAGPLVLQDEPTTSGVVMSAEMIATLASRVPLIEAVKLEEAPTPPKVSALAALRPQLSVFGGLGGVFFLEELRRGAVGTMTGFAFPEALVAVYRAHRRGNVQAADSCFEAMISMARYENQATISLALRKEALRLRGVLQSATVRQPAKALDDFSKQELAEHVAQMEKRLERFAPERKA